MAYQREYTARDYDWNICWACGTRQHMGLTDCAGPITTHYACDMCQSKGTPHERLVEPIKQQAGTISTELSKEPRRDGMLAVARAFLDMDIDDRDGIQETIHISDGLFTIARGSPDDPEIRKWLDDQNLP